MLKQSKLFIYQTSFVVENDKFECAKKTFAHFCFQYSHLRLLPCAYIRAVVMQLAEGLDLLAGRVENVASAVKKRRTSADFAVDITKKCVESFESGN